MESKREEAAPTFPTWKRRLEEAPESQVREEVDRFLDILKAVGTPMIDGTTVHFLYYGPEAQRVVLTGEFTQWGRRGLPLTPLAKTGIFYHSMEIRGPVRVEYKFIVDGQWKLDPFCPNKVDNGIGEQNSFFVVGDLQEPAELEWIPTIPHGRVEEFDFKSKVLHNSRRVYVYLPPDYAADSAQRFPTLYVHDGGEYLTRARLATVLDNLVHGREVPALVVVMVDPVDRAREYWANEDYGRFTEEELIPYIDEHYRTLAQRAARGVMGASLGGLISTYLALSRPHLFSKVGGQSSAFFLEQEKITALVRPLSVPIAFYFDVGKYEPQFIPAHRRLVPLLEAKGCPCFFQELAGGHNWTSWRAHLKDLLTFLWGGESAATRVSDRPEAEPAPPPGREPVSLPWDIDALLNRFLSGWERLFPGWLRPSSWDPQAEISMEGDKLICRIALPGVDPRDVEVLVVGPQLVIRGERKAGAPGQWDGNSSRLHPNQFERTFPLPEGVNVDNLTARYRDGVLEISMPVPKGIAARRIPIE